MSTLNVTNIQHSSNSGDANIELFSDGSTSIKNFDVTAINGGQIAFRNVLINGDVSVQERSRGSNAEYLIDRWFTSNSTPDDWDSDFATFPGQEFGRYIRVGNDTGNRDVLKQPIELPAEWVGGKAGLFTEGSTWTFSFYWDSSTNAPAGPQFGFADDSGNANAVSQDLDELTEVTGDTTTNGWQRVSTTFTIDIEPNDDNKCAYIQWAGNGTSATGFQLEPGSKSTPFEHRPTATELAMCQRYYQVVRGGIRNDYGTGSPAAFGGPLNFFQISRVTPTIGWDTISSADSTNLDVGNVSERGCMMIATGIATAGGTNAQEWTADFMIDAEL